MRKNNIFKLFVIVLFLLLAFALVGCNDDDNPGGGDDPIEIDWDAKIIESFELDQASFEKEYDIDDFDLALLKLHVYYTDGTDRLIPCVKEMFEDGDYDKLSTPGTKKVVIMYNDDEVDAKIKIVDYAIYDQDLNRMKNYDAVIKAIRSGNRLDFILESENDVAGMQAKYVFKKDLLKFSNYRVSDSSSSYGKCEIKDGELYVSFVSSKNLKGDNVILFSLDIEGDFRNSGLIIDESFGNKLYAFGEDDTTTKLFSVLFHVSKK